jgi:hypothetical protein
MQKEFHDQSHGDDHGSFQTWRKRNDNGFLINCKAKLSWMLHRVGCWQHLGDTQWKADSGASLTRHKKICSTSRSELVRIAKQSGAVLDTCAHCKP